MISESAVTGVPGATFRVVSWLPDTLEGGIRVGPYSSARPGMLLRVVPGVGRFLARAGTTIEMALEPGADSATVEALAQGGVLGALIHQRGELPLHATTLISRDRRHAIAIAGDSGAGKSTTAYELIRRGWTMLSDDLTRATISEGSPLTWPGRASLRLLVDACHSFGLDPTTLQPAPGWPDKYIIPVQRWDEPVPLSAIVCLERSEGTLQPATLSGLAAVALLTAQTYRIHYVAALGQTETHLRLVAAILSRTKLSRLRGAGTVSNIADLIEGVVSA